MDNKRFPSYDSLRQPSIAETLPHRSVHPRRLAPLETPPVGLHNYPHISPPQTPISLQSNWAVSTHVCPAAYPRCPSDLWVTPPPRETKEQQKQRIQGTVARFSEIKEAQEKDEDTRASRREILWTVANRYTAKRPQLRAGGLTLVLLHGIGCHKETWEPVIQLLLESLERLCVSLAISEFWTLDCVQHGDSGLVNESVLGDTFDCAEYARDLTNFLLWYLPRDASKAAPMHLPRLAEAEAELRHCKGIEGRTIVGVGHSIGACSFVGPAIENPALFSSLIFIESFTIPEFIKHMDTHRKNETSCLRRPWLWNSREEAFHSIIQSPYYRQWDARSIAAYCEHALTDTPDGKVRTKAHPVLEFTMLFERRFVYEAWELLDKIPSTIAMHWVWGGKSGRSGGKHIQAQTSYRRAQNSTNDFHPSLGHMLPQEAPDVLAFNIFRFLVSNYLERDSRL